jgi:hypothetical protein
MFYNFYIYILTYNLYSIISNLEISLYQNYKLYSRFLSSVSGINLRAIDGETKSEYSGKLLSVLFLGIRVLVSRLLPFRKWLMSNWPHERQVFMPLARAVESESEGISYGVGVGMNC